ncbi:lytic transglycosylase domain-containing protein [Hephaestia sp. GCM10023244]|uniref:lytic transglycosylase domain-containing protein n=1 Tax=unclassified Hephaestia TaxID=2631281 RepID=UPI0020771B2F|nr:lytic transglycosylase domain-containing protein [Hephaestia sp. MAHUQ-44]MCM8731328.1 lytic transglycosylase domain-containing protein [Hephaestia sp. MAHUQ-44]
MVAALKISMLAVALSGAAVSAQLTPEQMRWYATQLNSVMPQSAPANIPADPLAEALLQWKRFQQSDNFPFESYAAFLTAHPGWPGETAMRRAAEKAMNPAGGWSPAAAVAFFRKYPPLSNAGKVRFAEALMVTGDRAGALAAARDAWVSGSLATVDEAKVIGGFSSALTPADQDARMDMLLWQGATAAAQRQIALVTPANRPLFAARLACQTKTADAAMLVGQLSDEQRRDPGLIADRASWLRDTSQSPAARALLAQPHRLSKRPASVAAWYKVLLTNARAAAADGQYLLAYQIASQVDDAYPDGVDLEAQSYAEKDRYTDLVWLAGRAAFDKLNRPRDAQAMFDRYAKPFPTAHTRSKGLYWAGRSAQAAGDAEAANAFYTRASAFGDAFYGQLAAERLGKPLAPPQRLTAVTVPMTDRAAFYNREVVRAAQFLGQAGDHDDQTAFVRQIAADAATLTDHRLTDELSRTLARPDLAVMVGRNMLADGSNDYNAVGYPSVKLPGAHQDDFTMIHAIARQESQFDRAAVSHAGARGLMQLMPGTAREVANRIGLDYQPSSLTVDTDYNIQLGSTYFKRMYANYGSYPLAVAAYNAGPGNVNKWLAANGDPRTGAVDMIAWIEAIPFTETRNYVQRVLENAVVYDLLEPARARSRGPARLSWYLGKSTPG